jgi:hypothetical protein
MKIAGNTTKEAAVLYGIALVEIRKQTHDLARSALPDAPQIESAPERRRRVRGR